MFFVSVASTGFNLGVSLLFAALTRETISVAAKGLTREMCRRESNWVGLEAFEGVSRTARRASMAGRAPKMGVDLTNSL